MVMSPVKVCPDAGVSVMVTPNTVENWSGVTQIVQTIRRLPSLNSVTLPDFETEDFWKVTVVVSSMPPLPLFHVQVALFVVSERLSVSITFTVYVIT